MATTEQIVANSLQAIRNATYGEEVRGAIIDAISACYSDTATGVNNASDAASRAQTAMTSAENVVSNAAVVVQNASQSLTTKLNDFDTLVSQKITDYNTRVASAISDANSALEQANTAKNTADQANSNATSAFNSLNSLSVTYENVSPTTEGSVTLREINGHKDLYIKLRQGAKGDSMVIKGTAYATIELLVAATSTLNPSVGDMYNVGAGTAQSPYHIYRWTGDTSAGSSGWLDQGVFGSSISSVTTSEIDTLWGGGSASGTSYLDNTGLGYFINKIITALSGKASTAAATTTAAGLLSAADKTKLDGIATGAEVNVQSDWNQSNTSAKDYIKNKPNIPTAITIDTALDGTSTNPVQNKVVKAAIDGVVARHIKITDQTDLTFTISSWTSSGDSLFPYYTDLAIDSSYGIDSDCFVNVIFGTTDATSGAYGPICESRTNAIRIWATNNSITSLTLKAISAWR